jgi:hypothetical protein
LRVVTGEYTFPVTISIIFLVLIRLSSRYIPELNLDQKLDTWIWIIAILILTHPILIFQDREGFEVDFELFGMIKRTIDGGDEFFIFIISSLIYIFAAFGAVQTLYISDKIEKIEDEKLSKLISIDILPISAIVLIFIYFIQSAASSDLEEIEYSKPIKIIIYILFGYASMPNIAKPKDVSLNPN